jgi:hypothetical protein
VFPKKNATLISRTRDTPNLIENALAALGQVIPPREQQTAEALGAYHKAEIEKWWPIIKSGNVKAEADR